MDKQQLKDWKTRMNKMLQALRLLAEGNSPVTVAEKLGIKHTENLYRLLKLFRETDFPFMSQIVDAVKKEGLLEKSKWDWVQKARESKIRRAEQGFFMGTRATGYRILNGRLIEIKGEISRVDSVLYGFRVLGKTADKLAKDFKFPLSTVHSILRNPVYKGEFIFLGQTYKGNWKPRITPEEYDEIQSMLHGPKGGSRLSKVLYRWKDGRWAARPGAKELALKILEQRLEQKSTLAIAADLKVSRTVVDRVLKDRRVTGNSDFEQLVDPKKWEEAQKVHVPGMWELEIERTKQRRQLIMKCMPAFGWELRKKLGLSKTVVNSLTHALKREGWLKERHDGLLQKNWEPFPDKVLATQRESQTKRIKKSLEFLSMEKMTLVELNRRTGFPEPTVRQLFSRLRRMGVVKRQDYRGYRITNDWIRHVKKWLSQPHIANM